MPILYKNLLILLEKGNKYFREKNYEKAISTYGLLENHVQQNFFGYGVEGIKIYDSEEDFRKFTKFCIKVHTNMCVTYFKLKHLNWCICSGVRAFIQSKYKHKKSLFYLVRCYYLKKEYSIARYLSHELERIFPDVKKNEFFTKMKKDDKMKPYYQFLDKKRFLYKEKIVNFSEILNKKYNHLTVGKIIDILDVQNGYGILRVDVRSSKPPPKLDFISKAKKRNCINMNALTGEECFIYEQNSTLYSTGVKIFVLFNGVENFSVLHSRVFRNSACSMSLCSEKIPLFYKYGEYFITTKTGILLINCRSIRHLDDATCVCWTAFYKGKMNSIDGVRFNDYLRTGTFENELLSFIDIKEYGELVLFQNEFFSFRNIRLRGSFGENKSPLEKKISLVDNLTKELIPIYNHHNLIPSCDRLKIYLESEKIIKNIFRKEKPQFKDYSTYKQKFFVFMIWLAPQIHLSIDVTKYEILPFFSEIDILVLMDPFIRCFSYTEYLEFSRREWNYKTKILRNGNILQNIEALGYIMNVSKVKNPFDKNPSNEKVYPKFIDDCGSIVNYMKETNYYISFYRNIFRLIVEFPKNSSKNNENYQILFLSWFCNWLKYYEKVNQKKLFFYGEKLESISKKKKFDYLENCLISILKAREKKIDELTGTGIKKKKVKKRRTCSFCYIIGSKFKKCINCKKHYYCSKDCQRKHWIEEHKLNCQKIK